MTAQIATLVTAPADEGIVEALTVALEQARRGEIHTLVMLIADAKGVNHAIRGVRDRWQVAGYLEHAKHLILHDEEYP